MRTRADIQDAFVDRFHLGAERTLVTGEQLDAVEAALNTKLPAAYRQFMIRHGVIHSQGILGEIVDNQLEPHPDVQDFLEPQEAIDNTKSYWSAGMPDNLIGIASDCMGNMIGFNRHDSVSDDAPVLFFDHDFVEVNEIAPSFDDFLTWYLDHLKGQPTNG
jgi:SMI1 / KNR4 family (SUKH-1)